LIQYALAIDRVNEHVAFMYQPFHPAILRMILQVIKAAKQAGIKVALCGEMAGDPLCTSVLLAMGIDELSLNAGGIPMIKKVIRSLSLDQAKTDLKKIMKLDTATQVREFILKKMKPLLEELDHRLFIAAGG
jgi:phosphotransferase system enzyme I (PtsI)